MDPLTRARSTPAGAEADTGVADAVLHEVSRMLDALARDAEFADAVDLHSLPLADTDRERLRQRLGSGEVEALLDLVGPTTIAETAYAGVWWVRHAEAGDRTGLEQIVVARVPALLLAHPADIADAARRLGAELDATTRQETVHE